MSSPIQNKVLSDNDDGSGSCWTDDGYLLSWTDEITEEEINEMFGVTAKTHDAHIANDANNSIGTNTNTNETDSAEITNKVIDGKLHYWEPSGRFRPVEVTPEVLKQWVKDECRDTRKKDEWIKLLMEAPLDPN
ncbi:hypothetical protein LCI18_003464 [Fusarium solani-melongenae]|uniref:Uncharacterized protein n=1 Tax=Fusarium solani subsp. cucurbitae TaxID=2747967 RepID=A0ACD3YU97_FUSSC|nr:hypothetical protein LCI18_003464 [Fusarium solani-melongenae]